MRAPLALLVALAVALAAAPASTQTPRPDFSGTWVMDTTKFEKADPVLAALTIAVSQGPDTLGVKTEVGDRRGPGAPITRTTTLASYLLDGQAVENRMPSGKGAISVLSWDHETLVFRTSGPGPDGQTIDLTTRWTLEAGGARLVQQQRMQHGERVANQTLFLFKR